MLQTKRIRHYRLAKEKKNDAFEQKRIHLNHIAQKRLQLAKRFLRRNKTLNYFKRENYSAIT